MIIRTELIVCGCRIYLEREPQLGDKNRSPEADVRYVQSAQRTLERIIMYGMRETGTPIIYEHKAIQ